MATRQVTLRLDKEEYEWFASMFPWHGALPGFVNNCLTAFRKEWGNSPAPHSYIPKVIRRVNEEKGF